MPQRYTTYECPYLQPIIVYYSVSLSIIIISLGLNISWKKIMIPNLQQK